MTGNILIVEDDASMAETLAKAMRLRGFATSWCTSASAALKLLEEQDFDVIVSDMHMEEMDGIALCERVVANRPNIPVVIITAFGSMDSAVAAMRVGAYDFVTKPFELEALRLTLVRAVHHRALREEVKRLRQEVAIERGTDKMIGESPAIMIVKDLIERLAESDATILIAGASGTGKELVAQSVHRRSRNAAGPFVALNCAAMPESLLESELFGHVKGAFTDARAPRQGLFLKASGGTLFLDEIGEMPIGMQPKLLRALQEKVVRPVGGDREIPYEARIITASNRDIETEVEERRFREDLFYRINVVRIDVPALKYRGNDILLLAHHFVTMYASKSKNLVTGISPAVAAKLLRYQWPGNVRELQNCIERAVALTRFSEISVDDLPERIRDYQSNHLPAAAVAPTEDEPIVPMDEIERRYVMQVLARLNGNKTTTAQKLGMDRRTLYRKIERWESDAKGAPAPV